MDELYVIISGKNSVFEKKDGKVPEDCLQFMGPGDSLNKTYGEFLEEVYINSDPGTARRTYEAIGDVFNNTDTSLSFGVELYNRTTGESETKELDEIIMETAGGCIYTDEYNIKGRNRSVKALEMYITTTEFGGNDDS